MVILVEKLREATGEVDGSEESTTEAFHKISSVCIILFKYFCSTKTNQERQAETRHP